MPSPPDPLITPAELSRFGVPADFLSQFAARPFEVQVGAAGALGQMGFFWRYLGDSDASWSAARYSSAGSSWVATVDEVFADLTFQAASYGLGDTYLVDASGLVTSEGAAPAGRLSAALFDLRAQGCSAVTSEALTRMRQAIAQPLVSWGDDARRHAGAMVYAFLKRAKGATPSGAGAGDDQVFKGEELALAFFDGIGRNGRPDSMVDSSTSDDGPMLADYPSGDCPRGW